MGNSVASIIGGVAAYGIGGLDDALASWQYLFIIFGAVTAIWGVVMLILLPDSPANVIWLNPRQREVAIHRVITNQTGVKNNQFKVSQMIEAFRDPKTGLLVLYIFCVNLANGGLTSFGSLVLKGFGYKDLSALLIQMPVGAAQIGFVIVGCGLATKVKNGRIIMFCLTVISVVGMALMYALGHKSHLAGLTGFCLSMGFAANMPLGLSLISSNVAGFTKKATVNALTFITYCLGNIVGPQFFSISQAPRYPRGITASLCGFCLVVVFIASMRFYLM
jgi:MFS family permease